MTALACAPRPGPAAPTVGVAWPEHGREAHWAVRSASDVGLAPNTVESLSKTIRGGRWALWRHGYLVHSEGSRSRTSEVKSLRKSLFAAIVGGAIHRGRIASLDESVAAWLPELPGGARITWRHLLTQTSGLHDPAVPPGAEWAYIDDNALVICRALARVWGKHNFDDGFDEIAAETLFDPIGAVGWETSSSDDGVRFDLNLDDLGRLGLLLLSDGVWRGERLLPPDFARELGRVQVANVRARHDVDADFMGGFTGLRTEDFPEAPYGYMTWSNEARDLWPAARSTWSMALGLGGNVLAWDDETGVVLAMLGGEFAQALEAPPGWPVELRAVIESLDAQVSGANRLVELGPVAKWSGPEIELHGRAFRSDGSPNPFGVKLEAWFTSPSGRTHEVRGFFDGDGHGGRDGDRFRVRFSADEIGRWEVRTRSSERAFDGALAWFDVVPPDDDAPQFARWGRLVHPGVAQRYPKFVDGPDWLKAGFDVAESFLGGFEHSATEEQRLRIIDHLADKGVNSIQVVLHNIGSDDAEVWPWLGSTPDRAKLNAMGDVRFDVPRLAEWRRLFEYMQRRGIVAHLVLEDDSAWTGYDHARYYREIVARFGDLNAVLFDVGVGRDGNDSPDEALALLAELARLDPYGHPRGAHVVIRPVEGYLASPHVDFASIRTDFEDPTLHNASALEWIEAAGRGAGRVPMIGFDVPRPRSDRRGWWSAYLGGAVTDARVERTHDRALESWDRTSTELGGARAFMENLPFAEMAPCNERVQFGRAFCLGCPGGPYALYLPEGGVIEVELERSRLYDLSWWDPANGRDGTFLAGGELTGGLAQIVPPRVGDIAARIVPRDIP